MFLRFSGDTSLASGVFIVRQPLAPARSAVAVSTLSPMPLQLANEVWTKGTDKGKRKVVFSRIFKEPESLPKLSRNDGPGASGDRAPPAERIGNAIPSQPDEQASTLWEEAAKSLKPEDWDKLAVIIKSRREGHAADASSRRRTRCSSPDVNGGASLTDHVNCILSRAQALKDQDEKTWRPVSSTPSPNLREMRP